MKRKSKKHESKGSPEKSPEKPSRRSGRHSKRRRKSSSSSSSPEREKVPSKVKEVTPAPVTVKDSLPQKPIEKVRSYTPELVKEKINKDVEKKVDQEAGTSRRSSKRVLGNDQTDTVASCDIVLPPSSNLVNKKDEGGSSGVEWKEDKSFWEEGVVTNKVEESAENKGKEKDSGSVWKVQSANGAGGEIQKLKICRQRMADSQSQDESPNSPKRRSSRIKDLSNKTSDELSATDTDDQSNADGGPASADKTTKQKTKSRSSSRSSPAVLDTAAKVVCDVSEETPTKIIIHIENKSPEKASLSSPLPNKEKSEENLSDTETPKELNSSPVREETVIELPVDKEDDNPNIEDPKSDVEISAEKITANENTESIDISEVQLPPGEPIKISENDKDVIVNESVEKVELKTSECVNVPKETEVDVSDEKNETLHSTTDNIEPIATSRNNSASPRETEKVDDKCTTDESTSTSEDSDGSNESDSDGKKLKRKKRRKVGVLSTVTRTPRHVPESPPPPPLIEEDLGNEEPINEKKEIPEEGELEDGEAPDIEAVAETKPTQIASNKENVSMVSSQQQPAVSGSTVEPVQRKRRWGASKSIRPPKKPVLCISTDSLKNLIPEAKLVPIEEVRLSVDEDGERDSENGEIEKSSSEVKEAIPDHDNKIKDKKDVKREGKEKDKDRDRDRDRDRERDKERDKERVHRIEKDNDIKEEKVKGKEKKDLIRVHGDRPSATDNVSRRICVLSDDARKLVRSPSPARHRPSNVLYITNLVRPFTVQQLKNLLARTGKIAENGFWIDKIKSKCYVQYTDEEAAIETRHALHGVRWPVSNPRTLCVEFASYDDMAVAQALSEETEPIPRKAEPLQVDHSMEGWLVDQARFSSDRTQRRVVREWDVGKPAHPDEELEVRPTRGDYDEIRDREREIKKLFDKDREGERDRRLKKDRHRSRSPDIHEPPARKPRRKDEDAPAKLLDDLFRKTKTSPCIYWLPLTAEQIVVKEEMRRQHMAEHERRVAEMKKAEQARRDRERDRRRK